MPLSKAFDEALTYAAELHRSQARKGAETPYVGHLLSVAGLVLENHGTEDQAIAALLHDAIEDQAETQGGPRALGNDIERRFGPQVRAIVEACTDSWTSPKPAWRQRKEAYIRHVPQMGPQAALVSLSDKVHNARSILMDLRTHGAAVFDRFTAKQAGTLWYYQALAQAFAKSHRQPLSDELERVVQELVLLASKAAP